MSSDKQLSAWCHSHNVSNFKGVFSSDQTFKINTIKDYAVIFNYDPDRKPGSHWVACRKTGTQIIWFDSYGHGPDRDDISLNDRTHFRQWIQAQNATLTTNRIDLQHLDTSVCGQYCCWFLLYGLPSSASTHWNWLSKDKYKNDQTIQSLVKL